MRRVWFKKAAAVIIMGIMACSMSLEAHAATGKVTASSVKVRESASTQSGHIFSLNMGDKVNIVSQEKDSSGYVWYKIALEEGGYGYVRSDLVQSDGPVDEASASDNGAGGESEAPAHAYTQRRATVKAEKANVRKGAGTVHDSVGTVAGGDEVTVIGEQKGTDNKTWYEIEFGGGNTGFIRGDLVELGEIIEQAAPEETYVAEESSTPVVESDQGTSALSQAVSMGNGEYSLAYKADENGLETWYLYDNVESTQVKMTDLLNAANNGRAAEKLLAQNRRLKLIIIIMAVALAVLVIFAILLAYRMRDLLYYDDDEYGGKGGFDDPGAGRRGQTGSHNVSQPQTKAGTSRESAAKPQQSKPSQPMKQSQPGSSRAQAAGDRQPGGRSQDRASVAGRSGSESKRDLEASGRSGRSTSVRPESGTAASGRKKSSFGGDDEDFEFEFLDLDDKK